MSVPTARVFHRDKRYQNRATLEKYPQPAHGVGEPDPSLVRQRVYFPRVQVYESGRLLGDDRNHDIIF